MSDLIVGLYDRGISGKSGRRRDYPDVHTSGSEPSVLVPSSMHIYATFEAQTMKNSLGLVEKQHQNTLAAPQRRVAIGTRDG
jgi:hypothetical protein